MIETNKDLQELKDLFTHPGYKVLQKLAASDMEVLKAALEDPNRPESDIRVIQGRIIQLNITMNLEKAIELNEANAQEELDASL